MSEEIKKHKYEDLQIEVVPLETLTKANKDFLVTPHRTNFYHIFLFENSQPPFLIDFEDIEIQPYTLLFVNKDHVHQFDKSMKYEGLVLIFTDAFFCISENDTTFLRSGIFFNDYSTKPALELDKNSFEKFKTICENIADELSLPSDKSKHILLKNLLQNLLLLAEREKGKRGFTELKKGDNLDYTLFFQDLLERNFAKLKKVNDYAKLICISEKRLAIATTKVLGETPKAVINNRILMEAKRFLVHTNLTVKEIGQKLGFEDSAYFVRYFKKNTENTPLEFREKYLKK